jgi:hypothetical protein
MGHWSAPLDDLRMRRALVKAVDRGALNKAIYLNTLRASKGTLSTRVVLWYRRARLVGWESLKFDPPARKSWQEVARDKKLKLPIELQGVCEQRPDRQLFCEFSRPPGMTSASSLPSRSWPTLPSVSRSWNNARRTSTRPAGHGGSQ